MARRALFLDRSSRAQPRRISAWTREKITATESLGPPYRGTRGDSRSRAFRSVRDVHGETLKSHFNEKGKSRITALTLRG